MSTTLHRDLLELDDDGQAAWWWQTYTRVTGGADVPPVWWRDRQRLFAVCEQLHIAAAVRDAFLAAADRIDREAPQWWTLLAVAERLHRCEDDELRGVAVTRPGPPRSRWGELADLFPALVHLTGLWQMVQAHRARGIPLEVTRAAADDIVVRMEKFFEAHGTWGTTDKRGWFNRHLRLRVFQLGRLQFEIAPFPLRYMVLAGRSGAVAILLQPGETVRADGQFASADGGVAEHAADNWTSTLSETDDAWVGHQVAPAGHVEREPQRFAKSDWQVVLQRGDPVLSVHIPERGRLDPAACVASFAQAERFFPRYFPEVPFRGFFCVSWLMDPQLACVLDEQSNLRRFLSLFHLAPTRHADDQQMFERVFDGKRTPAEMPRDTTLRRRLITEIEAGRRWRTAAGIRLRRSPEAV